MLLQFISIIYEPVSINFLAQCLPLVNPAILGNLKPVKDDLRERVGRYRRKGLLNAKNQCPADVAEIFSRQAFSAGYFSQLAALIEKVVPVDYTHGKWPTRCWRALRQFRIGVYLQDFDKIDAARTFFDDHCRDHLTTDPPAFLVVVSAFDGHWFGSLSGSLQFYLLGQVFRYAQERLLPIAAIIAYLEDNTAFTVPHDERVPFHRLMASH